MKKTLITSAALVLGALSAPAQQALSAADFQTAVTAALIQQQQLQSYGDAWAARHGYTYNPWTSYYQYRAEREQRQAQRNDPFFWLSVIDEDQ